MAKDDDTGIDPVAKDGEVDEAKVESIETAKRKRNGGGSAATRGDLAAEQAKLDAEDGKGLDVGDAGTTEEEDDGQYAFVVPQTGKRITLGTMIPRGCPTKVRYKMSGKSIGNVKGGLLDPSDPNGLLVVAYVVEDVQTKFTRNSDRKIESATIYVVLAPTEVVPAHSEAGQVLLNGGSDVAAA